MKTLNELVVVTTTKRHFSLKVSLSISLSTSLSLSLSRKLFFSRFLTMTLVFFLPQKLSHVEDWKYQKKWWWKNRSREERWALEALNERREKKTTLIKWQSNLGQYFEK